MMSGKMSERKTLCSAGSFIRILSLVCLMVLFLNVRAKADDVLNPMIIQNPGQIDALFEARTGLMCEYSLGEYGKREHRYASIVIPERGWLNLKSAVGTGHFNARSTALYYDAERTRIRGDRNYSGAGVGGGAWYLEAGTYYLDFNMCGTNTYGWYGYFVPDSAAGITVSQGLSSDGRSVTLSAASAIDGDVEWRFKEGACTMQDISRDDGGTIDTLWHAWKGLGSIKKNGFYTVVALPGRNSGWYSHPIYLVLEVTGIDERAVVSFDSAGGDKITETIRVAIGSPLGTLPTPTRAGYTFKGWYTGRNGTGEEITASTVYGSIGDMTLYAYWVKGSSSSAGSSSKPSPAPTVKYTVTFKANGGKAVTQKSTVTKGGKYGTLPTTSRKGYTFKGWYTAKSGGSKVTASTKYTASKNTVLYAHWSKKTYKITYKTNGGRLSGSYKKSYTVTTATFTLPTPKRSGYTFLGWSSKSGSFKSASKVKKGSTGNKTFYAFWRQNEKVYTSTSKDGKATYYRPPYNGANGLGKKMQQHYYLVGTEIPAGEYLLKALPSAGKCYFEVAKQSGANLKKTRSGDFRDLFVIELKKGEYFHFRNSTMIRMADVTGKLYSTAGLGMFKVGKMVPTGTLRLKATGKNASYEIHSDARGTVVKSKKFSGTVEVTVKKGQYLFLKEDCRLR